MPLVEQHEETDSLRATRAFIERVTQIPGVRLEHRGKHSLRVFLPSRESAAWTQVRELEAQVLSAYPGARLDVWVSEERKA